MCILTVSSSVFFNTASVEPFEFFICIGVKWLIFELCESKVFKAELWLFLSTVLTSLDLVFRFLLSLLNNGFDSIFSVSMDLLKLSFELINPVFFSFQAV